MKTAESLQSSTPVIRAKSHLAGKHLQSSRFARRLAKALLYALVLSVIAIAFLPWQQTSKGIGQVVAYAPQERQQTIDSRIKGVVSRVADGLVEGSKVSKGDFILEIQPFAKDLAEKLRGQLKELNTKLDTNNNTADAYQKNVEGFSDAKDYAVSAASQMVQSANAKLTGKQELVKGYIAKEKQARQNYERQLELFESGIKPAKEIEKLKKEWDVAKSELDSAHQEVESSKNELAAKKDELEEKRSIAQTKIDYSRAMQQDAVGKAATTRKEIRELEVKLSTLNGLTITAPRDGTIYRMPVYEQGQTIKEGEAILTLVPDTTQKAVELFINGNDTPLVFVDQNVRLQFEGWPSVQVPGWPSLAVQVFDGKVASVDSTDNGKDQFRILVLPNEEDTAWPSDRILRQGVRANGWVAIGKVSLGYELWRQLNGFPVMIDDAKPEKAKNKPPKIPK